MLPIARAACLLIELDPNHPFTGGRGPHHRSRASSLRRLGPWITGLHDPDLVRTRLREMLASTLAATALLIRAAGFQINAVEAGT
jgi:hypothetical protein